MIGLHALFQQRIAGDDALLRLARLRFEQAGLAAEVYAGSAQELERMLSFAPAADRLPTVHLPRDLHLLDPAAQDRIAALARRFGSRVSGFVVHDRRDLPARLPELAEVAQRLSAVLDGGAARLAVEYAVGVSIPEFVAIAEALAAGGRTGVCVDIGHVGIRQARWEFARRRPEIGRDLTDLDLSDLSHLSDLFDLSDPSDLSDLSDLVEDVQAAVASALPAVLDLIGQLGAQRRPVHFHLHDGHPLVRGLADHYGFLMRLPTPFARPGGASLDPMFGVSGLGRLMATIRQALGGDASLTLEIHEHRGRLELTADERELFAHWTDLTNAERMNLWLRDLADNATLVRAV